MYVYRCIEIPIDLQKIKQICNYIYIHRFIIAHIDVVQIYIGYLPLKHPLIDGFPHPFLETRAAHDLGDLALSRGDPPKKWAVKNEIDHWPAFGFRCQKPL